MVAVFIVAALLLVIAAVWLIRMIATWRCIKTIQEKPHVRVKYYCTKRPPDVGMLPLYGHLFSVDYGERKYVGEIDRMAYGEAIYNRELTHENMSIFGLIREPQE